MSLNVTDTLTPPVTFALSAEISNSHGCSHAQGTKLMKRNIKKGRKGGPPNSTPFSQYFAKVLQETPATSEDLASTMTYNII